MHTPTYNRKNPFRSPLIENRLLNKAGSEKDTRHLVFNLTGSGLTYQPGDSLGVFPKNPPALVAELISLLKLDPATPLTTAEGTSTLLQELTSAYTLNRVGKKFVKAVVEKLPAGTQKETLTSMIENAEALDAYVFSRDYVDVLKEFPDVAFTAEEFISLLMKINPRLYSIASSLSKNPNEVHLTVAVVSYTTHSRLKRGLASGYLAYDIPLQETAPIFFQPSRHFHLPENSETPIIMVGPGTGIAPFRAFLEQRHIEGAGGRNWLFFGEQRSKTDFLYSEEFAEYQKQGLLTKLDTAFSRDQEHKVYVQHRMLENGAELWKWLQEGAYFYVCGDATRMAKDVHQALIEIAHKHGSMTLEAAEEYINNTLAKVEKRYLRDVY